MAGSNVHAPVDTYLRAISEAHTVLEHAKHQQNPAAASTAHQQLRVAVEAARDAGATWMQIGDLLPAVRGITSTHAVIPRDFAAIAVAPPSPTRACRAP